MAAPTLVDKNALDALVNNIKTKFGKTVDIGIAYDSANSKYVISLALKNFGGTSISSDSIDLPVAGSIDSSKIDDLFEAVEEED